MMSFASILATVDPEERPLADDSRRVRSEALLLSLARVLRRMSEPGNPETVFDQILEDAIEITDSEYGYVGQVCRDGQGNAYLRLVAARDVTGLRGARGVLRAVRRRGARVP